MKRRTTSALTRPARTPGQGGIPAPNVERLLAGDEGRAEVLHEEARYKSLGVSGVPSFFFNGKIAFSGAVEAPLLADAIRQGLLQ